MKLIVNVVDTEVSCQATFNKALLELLKEEYRISTINKLMDSYSITFNALQFNNNDLSNSFCRFSKIDNSTHSDISFGIEAFNSIIRQPSSIAESLEFNDKLFQILGNPDLSLLKINIAQHLSTEDKVDEFLETLNPYTPKRFQDHISEKGVNYTLKRVERGLNTSITLTNSRYVPGGLFIHFSFEFPQNQSDFSEAFNDMVNDYSFILEELNITFEKDN